MDTGPYGILRNLGMFQNKALNICMGDILYDSLHVVHVQKVLLSMREPEVE